MIIESIMMRKTRFQFGIRHMLAAVVVCGIALGYMSRVTKPRVTTGEAISGRTFRFDVRADDSLVFRLNNTFASNSFWKSLRRDLGSSHGVLLNHWSRDTVSCVARRGLDGRLRVDFSAPAYSVTYVTFDLHRGIVRSHGYSKDKHSRGARESARTRQADVFGVVKQRIEAVVASELSPSQTDKTKHEEQHPSE